jgi:mono/diheme cytochrome c family protein
MKKSIFFLFLPVLSLLLAACTGAAAAPAGDPQAGPALFRQNAIEQAPGCATCHSTEPGKVIVGPSLAGVAKRAATRIPGKPAPEYLRESILNPNGYVVDGFPSGVMYQSFKEILTEDQVNNLVAYLLTFK